jgi:Lar family restriction alleviation protein
VTELKPCPFCGSEDIEIDCAGYLDDSDHWVICQDCGAASGIIKEASDAIEAWNTRADDKIIEAAHEVASCLLLENMQRPGLTFRKIKELSEVLYEEK